MSGRGLRAIRLSINRIVTYVNTNGVWNLFGWVKTGEIVDAVDREETLASEDIHPHLIKMSYIRNRIDMETVNLIQFDANAVYTAEDLARLTAALENQKNTGVIEEMNAEQNEEGNNA